MEIPDSDIETSGPAYELINTCGILLSSLEIDIKSGWYSIVKNAYLSLQSKGLLPTISNAAPKSKETSLLIRKQGNVLHENTQYDEALLKYTKAIISAPPDTEEIAVAFGNRSAALFRLKKYASCLLDINRALNMKYPEHLKSKLISRKKSCIEEINKQNKANASWLANLNRPANEEFTVERLFLITRSRREINLDFDSTEPQDDILPALPKLSSENKLLPNASPKIEIRWNKTWERHFVAKEDISPGEILVIEKSFAWALDAKCLHTNCSFCFTKCDTLIPCTGCSEVMYCGNRCRQEAYELYHRVECEIISFFPDIEVIRADMLALRILLIGTEQGKLLLSLRRNENFKNIFKDTPKYIPYQKYTRDYLSVCNLKITKRKLLKSTRDTQIRVCRAVLMLHLLKQSSFFDSANEELNLSKGQVLTDPEIFAGYLLLNHYLLLHCNSYGVQQAKGDYTCPEEFMTSIGKGLNSLLSLVNHSCDPNVNIISNRNSSIMFSLRPIPAGQQIFYSYCSPFYDLPTVPRRQQLAWYDFECRCPACVNNWPLLTQLPRNDPVGVSDEIKKRLTNYRQLKYVYKVNGIEAFEERLKITCECSSFLHKIFKQPSKDIVEWENRLILMMLLKYGNIYFDS